MVDIQHLQSLFDMTDYCDADILDFQASYFGDEVTMYIDIDENFCWKVHFTSCSKVNYQTDASWRRIPLVRQMHMPQLGYVGQVITVTPSENHDFYCIFMNFSIAEVTIECRDVSFEKTNRMSLTFFWETQTQES